MEIWCIDIIEKKEGKEEKKEKSNGTGDHVQRKVYLVLWNEQLCKRNVRFLLLITANLNPKNCIVLFSFTVNEGGIKQASNLCPDPGEPENGKRIGSDFR